MRGSSLFLVVLAATLPGCGRADDGWRLAPTGRLFEVKGKIREGKDVSGAAMLTDSLAVVASDETRELQFLRFDVAGANCRVEGTLALLDGDGTEIDIEGVAVSRDTRRCYVTGSHSLSRKKTRFEADRNSVFSLGINAKGYADRTILKVVSLREMLKADPVLAPYLDKSAAENGLDIEGLAVRGDKLYFGLRAPNLDGKAFVLVTDAGALFSNGKMPAERVAIPFGAGRGIRDIVAIAEGFLVIVGSSGSDDAGGTSGAGFTLHFWAGPQSVPTRLGEIPSMAGKPEGLLVLTETSETIDVLVFHDGGKDGAPREFRVSKPSLR